MELRVLQATVTAGFSELHRRFDDHEEHEQEHRRQVVTRLDLINGRVEKAHVRLSVLEALHKALDRTVEGARRRVHELVAKLHGDEPGDEARAVTRADLRWIFVAFVAGGGVVAAILGLIQSLRG